MEKNIMQEDARKVSESSLLNQPLMWKYILPVLLLLILIFIPVIHLWRVIHLGDDASLNFYLHVLLLIFLNSTLASSWNIMGGYTGYISLGHNVFFAIGGYLAGVLLVYFNVSVFVSAPLAGLFAMGVAFIVGFITLRVRGPAFIIATVALVLLARIILDNWDLVNGTRGMSLPLLIQGATFAKIPFYYAMLIIAIGTIYLSYRVRHSKFGLGLRAISQDEIKAESAGIPTSQYKILAFALSGFFIGAAGAIYGQYVNYLQPGIFLVIRIGAQMVLISILGGKGTVTGPVVGTVIIITINELVLSHFGGTELNIFATGFLMLIVLLFFPDGFVGSLRKRGHLPAFLDWD